MDEPMYVEEYARLTGQSPGQVRNLHSRRKLKGPLPYKIGRRLLWDRQEVAAFIAALKASRDGAA